MRVLNGRMLLAGAFGLVCLVVFVPATVSLLFLFFAFLFAIFFGRSRFFWPSCRVFVEILFFERP